MYWTNPFILCDMNFPTPQSLSAALFIITTALLFGSVKTLSPVTAAVAALINYSFGIWLAIASVDICLTFNNSTFCQKRKSLGH